MPHHLPSEQDDRALRVRSAKTHVAGVRGVGVAMHRALRQMGTGRSVTTLGSTATGSDTPTSNSDVVRLQRSEPGDGDGGSVA